MDVDWKRHGIARELDIERRLDLQRMLDEGNGSSTVVAAAFKKGLRKALEL